MFALPINTQLLRVRYEKKKKRLTSLRMRLLTTMLLGLFSLAHPIQSISLRAKFPHGWEKTPPHYGQGPSKRSVLGLGGNSVVGGGGGGERGREGQFLSVRDVPPKLVEARQHGKVVLGCSASGSPAPKITWYKDGRPLFKEAKMLGRSPDVGESMGETKSKVVLACLDEEDAGMYECVATNGYSKTSVATELNVASFRDEIGCRDTFRESRNDKPAINQYMESYMQLIGRDALLLCRSTGALESFWMAPNQARVDLKSGKYQVTANGDLIVRNLSFDDMGMFQCFVRNTNGQNKVETFVYPLAVS